MKGNLPEPITSQKRFFLSRVELLPDEPLKSGRSGLFEEFDVMPGCYAVFHKQLGDLVLLEPTLAKLCEHHGAPVECMTRSGHAPLLKLMPGVQFRRGIPLAYRSHLYCFDPLSKSALRSMLAPSRIKKCVLPEKREMRWYHSSLFRELIVPELGDRYVAESFFGTAHRCLAPPRSDPLDLINRPITGGRRVLKAIHSSLSIQLPAGDKRAGCLIAG